MPHIEDVLLWMVSQKGDRYIFGAEAKASDPNPSAFDCSELVEWACARAGVTPTMPDGAFNQWKHCTRISVEQGMTTRGALLFVGDGTGSGRDAIVHVAGSLGDGTTIEARGSKWGVGSWPSAKRFDFAGLIPGVDYSPGHGPLSEEDEMNSDQDARLLEVWQLIKDQGPLNAAIGRIDARVAASSDPKAFASEVAAHLDGVSEADVEQAFRNVLLNGANPG